MAGANDVAAGLATNIYSHLEKYITLLLPTAKILVATLPYRHDLHHANPINEEICLVNAYIYELCFRLEGVEVIDVNQIGREGFTKHGLHLSRRGKRRLSRLIIDEVRTLFQAKRTSRQPSTTSRLFNSNNDSIEIVEMHMSDVIQQYRNDETVGFAHGISADFHDPRHMSAGVATVFREKFGKPTRSQRLTSHLALQRTQGKASVYSLITKDRFSGKPDRINYNLAFKHLTTDFKNKGLAHLICSPIGCVRDKVDLRELINNLEKFHQVTRAKITIVSYHKDSSRPLKNGVSYVEFNQKMKELIDVLQYDNCKPSDISHSPQKPETLFNPTTGPSTLTHDSYAAAVSHQQDQLPSRLSRRPTVTYNSPRTLISSVAEVQCTV